MPTSTQKENASVADFESPVLLVGSAGTEAVTLTDVSAMAKLLVRSDVDQFGIAFGASSGDVGGALVCGSRPGEWLIVGDAKACAAAAAGAEDGFTSVVEYTHSRALFRLAGPAASSALEKVCSIDWSDAMMPNGAVVSASVAKVSCDIIRNDTTPDGAVPDADAAVPDGEAANGAVADGGATDVADVDGGAADVADPDSEAADGGATDIADVDGEAVDVADPDSEAARPERSYLIACDRSFGQYLFDALLDATTEFVR